MLGAKDEFISPADCTELGPRAEFAYIELKGSNHVRALKLATEGDKDKESPRIVAERRERLIAALSCGFPGLLEREWALPPGDIDDYLDPMDLTEAGAHSTQGDGVQHAVMVVHGIRDNGFWTKRVAREVKTQARHAGMVPRAPSPSYGFFSMWDFIKPGGRRNATYWFMERYADVRSHFPHAAVSFVGHSNGTYIAANAMRLCPAIRFERVVFARSVVRSDYPWSERTKQVKDMLNYVGTADGVVAFLPAVFQFLGLRSLDVGGAGAFGFDAARDAHAIRPLALTEVRYVKGGHGAAIDEEYWPEIAKFVLTGAAPERSHAVRSRTLKALFACAPLLTSLGIALGVAILALPLLAAARLAWLAQAGIEHIRSPGKGDPWLPTLLADSPLLWPLSAMAMIGLAIGVSWLAGRFLRAW